MFGGNDGEGLYNDVWLLREVPVQGEADAGQLVHTPLAWCRPVVVGEAPLPRAGHSAVMHGSTVVLFGGSRGYGTPAFGDLHMLDVGNVEPWEEGGSGEAMVFWYRPSATGTPPSARAGHTAVVVGHNMLIVGGADAKRSFEDLHVLDCNTHTWSCPPSTGPPPCPRAGHSAVALGDTVVLFGGADAEGALLADVHVLETDLLLRTLPPQDRPAAYGGQGVAAEHDTSAAPRPRKADTGAGGGGATTQRGPEAALAALSAKWDARWASLQQHIGDMRRQQSEEVAGLLAQWGRTGKGGQ